jgi:hypothetical protein
MWCGHPKQRCTNNFFYRGQPGPVAVTAASIYRRFPHKFRPCLRQHHLTPAAPKLPCMVSSNSGAYPMANPKFPYVAWRDGRPRSKHGPRQRKRGFVDQDLKNPDGSWFTLEQAAEFSDRRVAEVKASRGAKAAETRLRVGAAGRLTRNTVADLLRDWQNAWSASMSEASRRSYRKCISALLWQPETPEQRKATLSAWVFASTVRLRTSHRCRRRRLASRSSEHCTSTWFADAARTWRGPSLRRCQQRGHGAPKALTGGYRQIRASIWSSRLRRGALSGSSCQSSWRLSQLPIR